MERDDEKQSEENGAQDPELRERMLARLRRCANSYKRNDLNLSNLDLGQLPIEKMSAFPSLEHLSLRGNQLNNFPASLCEAFEHLTELDLSRNRLTDLPLEFAKLRALANLSLDHNRLTELPLPIFELQNLRVLSAKSNDLTRLPAPPPPGGGEGGEGGERGGWGWGWGGLRRLERLDLWGNALRTLPPELDDLPNLQALELAGNPIEALPPRCEQLVYQRQLCKSKDERQKLIKRALKTRRAVLNAYQNELLANQYLPDRRSTESGKEERGLTTLPKESVLLDTDDIVF